MEILNVRAAQLTDYPIFAGIELASGLEPHEVASLDEYVDSLSAFDSTVGVMGRHTGAAACFVEYRKRVAKLIDLTVHPDWRRNQVGTRMIRHAKHRAFERGYTRMGCLLSERNVRGQLFLQSNGFRYVRTKPEYFGDDDAYVFACNLSEGDILMPVGGIVPPQRGYAY